MAVKLSSSNKLSSSLSEINVTPLVDVMLVLLIIFMVTTPMMQSGIRVNLPSAETPGNPRTGELVITVTKERDIYVDGQIINLFLLETRIKNYFVGQDQKKKIVFIKADKDVAYGYVIDVMDALKKAGIETVGMIVEQKKKK
ncbi:MAG: protein TolR [Candidatus Aminicenantes bacterium]|nr:protein TolR [Candidatus Aminicenantes bacterium]NIM81207.1 protein TolR [Candidatus Aminicenantes bacterium]NIN20582.1 protein TolR [Candidatus Aminicenantes bacterium]NIN44361.1 protein TolR [Candidatus Aminicenantes bacterium]NIN87180.1 protein TolR [Candidatus Aminicenantes bacterium]